MTSATGLRALILDNIAVHGFAWTARHYRKRVPFALFYGFAFGWPPRSCAMPPLDQARLRDETGGRVAQIHVARELLWCKLRLEGGEAVGGL